MTHISYDMAVDHAFSHPWPISAEDIAVHTSLSSGIPNLNRWERLQTLSGANKTLMMVLLNGIFSSSDKTDFYLRWWKMTTIKTAASTCSSAYCFSWSLPWRHLWKQKIKKTHDQVPDKRQEGDTTGSPWLEWTDHYTQELWWLSWCHQSGHADESSGNEEW